jgi:flagellar biosynthesis protein FliP
MNAAGYAGMLGTLAFVLGLIVLVARLAKRVLPGTATVVGTDTFALVQRIPLGQRQGIAVVQRGDVLIGVSVGDGGVRTLFTMPVSTSEMTRQSASQSTGQSTGQGASGEPALNVLAEIAPHDTRDLAPANAFTTVLGDAVRRRVTRALLVLLGPPFMAGAALEAQQSAPTRQPPAPTPTPALPISSPTQSGPRDQPARNTPPAQAPRSATPAQTPSQSGGAASIAPLIPASQARGITAHGPRANGTLPLVTVESQRIAGRADSMIAKLAPQMDLKIGGNAQGDGLRMSGTVGVVIMMGLLSLLPMLLLMMTGFTRILVVLHFLKQALGTQSAPPGQLLAAMALLLSGFVMGPTLAAVHSTALEPWMDGKIEQVEMMSRAMVPFKAFMVRQVRDQDLQTFVDLADIAQPESREAVPLTVLMSAFVTSELRTAFQIGFALFLPFIVIDVVVGSVLMSMGMVMLPPAMISMPFKLLLFVLVDGWGLVVTGLVQSFR